MYDWRENFGWSNSKSKNWRECKRRFYYSTIKKNDKDPEGLEFKYLSTLDSSSALKGKIVHRVIGQQITQTRSRREMNLEVAIREINRQWTPYLPPIRKKLLETMNGIPYNEALQTVRRESEICMDHFLNDVWPQMSSATYVEHDDGGERSAPTEFFIDGIKVYIKPDYLSRSDGVYTLTDWKTGKDWNDDYCQQMAVYTLFVMEKYNVNLDDIRAELVFLQEPNTKIMQSSITNIEKVKAIIKKESEEMLQGRHFEDFPPKVGSYCRYCNFLTKCNAIKESFDDCAVAEVEE